MNSIRIVLAVLVLAALGLFAPNVFAASTKPVSKIQKPSVAATAESTGAADAVEATEKKRAIEDVNTLIIDSYRARLDKTLEELFDNIRVATKNDESAQIKILVKIRTDLDDKLDALADANVSENRKKILLGVYFYLKSSIEAQIRELKAQR